jgi:hypothetical protein
MQCEDELYMNPVDLGDGVKAAEVVPNDDDRDWADGSGEDPEFSHFLRSGNIPEGSRVFFDRAMINQIDQDEYSIHVVLFVEGNNGDARFVLGKEKQAVAAHQDQPESAPTATVSFLV